MAKVVTRTPFTIRLLYGSSGYKQPVTLGVDSGFNNIGLSAITEKKELYRSEVKLRTDIVKLNSERRAYRRNRRNRKTWYRQPRFLNRKKPKSRLAPSIQHKLDSHIKVIAGIKKILPVTKINVEVAAFDIQKIKEPEIAKAGYQDGPQRDFRNTREYVLHRDWHACQHCNGKSHDKILEVHHIVSRQTGGDRPENLITLCGTCHNKVSRGRLVLKAPSLNGFKAETFMSIVRWKLVNQLKSAGNAVLHTYGYITKQRRIELKLPKSHANDAFVIAGGKIQKRTASWHFIQQVRRCNRKLFRGIRSHIKNTAARFIYGFQRYDKVLWGGTECFVFGRRATGYFELRTLCGGKLHSSAKAGSLILLESFNTFLTQRRGDFSSPWLKPGVSEIAVL